MNDRKREKAVKKILKFSLLLKVRLRINFRLVSFEYKYAKCNNLVDLYYEVRTFFH